MSDVIALQTKLNSIFTYLEFDTDFGCEPEPAPAQAGMLLSDLFARLEGQAPMARAA